VELPLSLNDNNAARNRAVLFAGGAAALVVVILGIFTKTAYRSVIAAALMWSAASLSMIVLGVAFVAVRRLFETPLAVVVAVLLFIKAVLVVFPLFMTRGFPAGLMEFLYHFKNVVNVLYMGMTAWVVFRGRVVLGKGLSLPVVALLTLATLGLLASHIFLYLDGSVPPFLGWTTILTTLLGIAGVGVGLIWLAFRRGEGGPADAA
jgi:hypothetical protein